MTVTSPVYPQPKQLTAKWTVEVGEDVNGYIGEARVHPHPEFLEGPFDVVGNPLMKGDLVRILCINCCQEVETGGTRIAGCPMGCYGYGPDDEVYRGEPLWSETFHDCGTVAVLLKAGDNPEILGTSDGARQIAGMHSAECMMLVESCRI